VGRDHDGIVEGAPSILGGEGKQELAKMFGLPAALADLVSCFSMLLASHG